MDTQQSQQLTAVLGSLGLGAALSAVVTVLGKTLSDALQRRSHLEIVLPHGLLTKRF